MAGIHETIKTVQRLQESLIRSAERAEQAVERVEGFEQRVERLVETMDRNAKRHEARVGDVYTRLEQRADASLVFWVSRGWVLLLLLVAVAFLGAAFFHLAQAFTGWVLGAGVELVGREQMGEPDFPPREAIVLLYQPTKTTVGQDVYVCIQCFRQQPGQGSVGPYRQSSPYVLSCQHGSRRVIPGSVCESLRNLSRQLEQLPVSSGEHVARIESAEADQRGEEYYEYDRHLTNSLVLISCLARKVFHTFPRLSEQYSVQMFDYGGKATDEIRVKKLLDLFVHNRYMNLKNEYIVDLVSEKLPDGTIIAEGFMGHKFKFQDFLSQVAEAIESVTIKDLTTLLRRGVKSLNLDTPYQEIVFLVQNITSFSDLLEATIPSESYDFMLNILFPGVRDSGGRSGRHEGAQS